MAEKCINMQRYIYLICDWKALVCGAVESWKRFYLEIALGSHLICISALNGFIAVMLNKIQMITSQSFTTWKGKNCIGKAF